MSGKEDFFVQVTLTPEQARTVVRALDVFTRIHLGQFTTVREQFDGRADVRTDLADKLLYEVRRILLPGLDGGPGHSYGITGCPTESGKISWDVLQVIRRTEAYGRRPEGGISVVFDEPLFTSESVPRPTAKRINVLDKLADL